MTRRLIVSYLSVTVFVLIVLEIPLGVFVASLQRERLEADLQRDAMVLATIYEDALDNNAPYSFEPAEDYAERTGGRVVVTDAAGISIVDTEAPLNRDFSTRGEVAAALAGLSERPATRFSETLGREILYVAVPVASGGVVHGAVRITFDPEAVNASVRGYWRGLAAIGGVVLAAVALIGWIIARSVTKPLTAMHDAAVAAGAGDLSVRIDPGEAPPEVADLARAFNSMAGRLQASMERQRAFVADASHELRTPLTALRLRLENIDAGLVGGSDDVAAAIAETERLAELVGQLLVIARTEGHTMPVGPVNLSAVVGARAELWAALAEERNVAVTTDVQASVEVMAVDGGVDQILDNLLSNAIAVSPAGTTIEVVVRSGAGSAEIEVADRGPGLAEEARERAFDRFWRGDASKEGTGLGLAIVRDLAVASGGSAALHARPGGGLRAVVTLRASGA
ncbi:MAG: ATP-binding protein [Acidimicrobiia bacterium]|nr:ATP-binding protein [Acidimicrobiia bacterium]